MSSSTNSNALQKMPTAQRIVHVLDHLGIEKAHFAAQMPGDWSELASTHADRIASLTLVCPDTVDVETLQGLAARLLLISGDQPPYGERMAEALARLPAAQQVALAGYANLTWNDAMADCIDVITPRLLTFLEAVRQGGPLSTHSSFDAAAGEVAGVTYQLHGGSI